MILVTGATGTIGRLLVRRLPAERTIAFVRDRAKAEGLRHVVGDFDDPTSLREAMTGVERLFLNAGGAVPTTGEQPMVRQQIAAIDAAVEAGVRHVVKLSVWHARVGGKLAEGAHGVIEEYLQASGLAWTILQPNGFMQNFSTGTAVATENGNFLGAYGDARVSYIDCDDIAASAAAALTGDIEPGQTFVLTGPEALTHNEIAAKLSAVVGRDIRYIDLPPAEFADRLTAAGAPEPFAADVAALFADVASGRLSPVTQDVETLTSRPPTTFNSFLHRHSPAIRAAWAN
ncbi:SDR family oxidoreductase [Actinokineospora globicatena]|uniref:NAD(P)-dependent oxidoreductase n=1 Tax=Actinokineospora globicatena TaxID=103729 RepID=A0A9W6QL01_9PSEU|nr:SDR family oxidoreductase [Actinokineospora globicatena]GLW90502.1 NAD(P)-dependent oxidoreductase [Actinokineospora globicatena]